MATPYTSCPDPTIYDQTNLANYGQSLPLHEPGQHATPITLLAGTYRFTVAFAKVYGGGPWVIKMFSTTSSGCSGGALISTMDFAWDSYASNTAPTTFSPTVTKPTVAPTPGAPSPAAFASKTWQFSLPAADTFYFNIEIDPVNNPFVVGEAHKFRGQHAGLSYTRIDSHVAPTPQPPPLPDTLGSHGALLASALGVSSTIINSNGAYFQLPSTGAWFPSCNALIPYTTCVSQYGHQTSWYDGSAFPIAQAGTESQPGLGFTHPGMMWLEAGTYRFTAVTVTTTDGGSCTAFIRGLCGGVAVMTLPLDTYSATPRAYNSLSTTVIIKQSATYFFLLEAAQKNALSSANRLQFQHMGFMLTRTL